MAGSKAFDSKKIKIKYDALDRLITITSPTKRYTFSYDPLNRMIEQKVFLRSQNNWVLEKKEAYLYDDKNELGAFPQELRILGSGKGAEIGATIAIEKNGLVYIPCTIFMEISSLFSILHLNKSLQSPDFQLLVNQPTHK